MFFPLSAPQRGQRTVGAAGADGGPTRVVQTAATTTRLSLFMKSPPLVEWGGEIIL